MQIPSWFRPPQFEDYGLARKAEMVFSIYLIFLFIDIPFFIYKLAIYRTSPLLDILSFLGIELFTLTALILLCKRMYGLSVHFFLSGLFVIFFYSSYSGAGVFSLTYLVGSIIIISAAGLFTGFSQSVPYAVLFVLEGILFILLQKYGIRNFSYLVGPVGAFMITILLLFGILYVIKIFNDILSASLKVIHDNESDLRSVLEELHKSKSELEITNRRLSEIIDFIPDPMFVIDSDKKVIAWNRAMESMFGVEKENVLGKGNSEYAMALFKERKPILIDLLDNDCSEIPDRYSNVICKDGKIFAETFFPEYNNGKGLYLWGVAAPLFDTDGNRSGSIEVIRNINALKESEHELRSSLKQRDVLIQELYHRTKNNMQVISSLLRLKSRMTEDIFLKKILIEIENKILSIALVHQKLYESQNLSELDLSEYIRDITKMMRSFPGFSESKVSFDLSLEKTIASIDVAIPCGLILNEMITNSLKHGFLDTSEGLIIITLKASDGSATLLYRDNGKGLPDNFNPGNTASIGFSLMKEMATRQMMASFDVTSENGFKCEMVIPLNRSNARI